MPWWGGDGEVEVDRRSGARLVIGGRSVVEGMEREGLVHKENAKERLVEQRCCGDYRVEEEGEYGRQKGGKRIGGKRGEAAGGEKGV